MGCWVVDFGISIGQYTEDGHVFLMRKHEGMAQSKSTTVKFIVVQEFIVLKGAYGLWLSAMDPDYLGYSLILL